ncbi:MAG TPA: hypothetical protein VMF30_08765 [Pirellulales bacterium]|nr:hypothetical protein [Pirellulales bacterium]
MFVNRRRVMFWMGFGLFSLAERLRADVIDDLAAKAMDAVGPSDPAPPAQPIHWRAAENNTWRWFEQEKLVDGKWQVSGITTPVHKTTGEAFTGHTGYLDPLTVPVSVRGEDDADETAETVADHDFTHHGASPARRGRHGRPPSRWLRSLHADELRIWLKTIDPPQAGVEGMTFLLHLTRDHSFDEPNVRSLTIDEQAKLHAAAHFGY